MTTQTELAAESHDIGVVWDAAVRHLTERSQQSRSDLKHLVEDWQYRHPAGDVEMEES